MKRLLSAARPVYAALLAAATLPSAGCTGMIGKMLSNGAVEVTAPYTLGTEDFGMACASGVAFGNFLMAYTPFTDAPHRANVAGASSAGMCAEADGFEAELRRLRALFEQRPAEAEDARISEQNLHYLAAIRNYSAYKSLIIAYGQPGANDEDGNLACPDLESDEPEKLGYLLGLSSGVLAVVHDRQSGARANVPMDIPPAIRRATGCFADTDWWGMPAALRSALELSLPQDEVPPEVSWKALATAAEQGAKAGMSLPRALLIQTLAAQGRRDEMCEEVARHAAWEETATPNAQYRLLDTYGRHLIRHEINKLWTERTGHRAPLTIMACPEAPEPVTPADTPEQLFGD